MANVECTSADKRLDNADDLQECAQHCRNDEECVYFLYADHNGTCWHEFTEDACESEEFT
jgi:hypothetical protein